MNSPENSKFDREFYRRIKHDFRKYVLLKSNGIHLNEELILQTVYKMEGYKRHKKVNHGKYTSHLIVMFIDIYAALEATARFNLMTAGVTAILVDDMLRCWFTHEKKICPGPSHSLTIVDIIGNPPLNLNFLTSHILSSIFKDFGAPCLSPYTAALNEPHMQVLFSSMTEALSACMAFGEWYRVEDKADCFFYRVRINPSNKEENMIKRCGGTPAEAFKLSYFITLKTEVKFERANDSASKGNGSQPRVSAIEGVHKQECPLAHSSKFRQTNTFGYGTPILYFPIIPINRNAHASINSQIGADFTTALLNLQQTVSAQPVVTNKNPETGNNRTRHHQTLEEIPECTDDKMSEHQSNVSRNNSNGDCQRRMHHDLTRIRGNLRRTSRVFERRR